MGLFDQLLKTAEKAATRAIKQELGGIVSEKVRDELDNFIPMNGNSASRAHIVSTYDTTPDLPRSFQHENSWICVKGNTIDEVISALGLRNPEEANWESGILAADKHFLKKTFVVSVGGYVLAIGYCPFGVKRSVEEELAILKKAAAQLCEMSCFATQSVVDLHVWARYEGGRLVRGYGWIGERGEIYLNEGAFTSEEISLGYTDFIKDTECDWDTARFPDNENVQAMAGAWGVAPDLSNVNDYETCTGFVCDI